MQTPNQESTAQTVSNSRWLSRCKAELPDPAAHVIFWPILVFGLALDLWTKSAVFAWLENESPEYYARIIDGIVTFRIALNDGAAFGIASGRQMFLAGVSGVALVVIFGHEVVGPGPGFRGAEPIHGQVPEQGARHGH